MDVWDSKLPRVVRLGISWS